MLFYRFRWRILALAVLIFATSNFLRSSVAEHGPYLVLARELISAFSPALAGYVAALVLRGRLSLPMNSLIIFVSAISGFMVGKLLLDMASPFESVLTAQRLPGELIRMALLAAPLSLVAAIKRAETPESLRLRGIGGELVLEASDIVFAEQRNRKTFITCRTNDVQVSLNLRDLEKRLRPFGIVRIHKRYLVNPAYVRSIQPQGSGRYLVRLADEEDTVLVAGRAYARKFREQLKQK